MAVVYLEAPGAKTNSIAPTILTLEPIAHQDLDPTFMPFPSGQQLLIGQFATDPFPSHIPMPRPQFRALTKSLCFLLSQILDRPLSVTLILLADVCQNLRPRPLGQKLLKFSN
jgi:hypothetical protein